LFNQNVQTVHRLLSLLIDFALLIRFLAFFATSLLMLQSLCDTFRSGCIVDFACHDEACTLVRGGVSAMLGPTDWMLGAHVQSVCDALDIPHLEARPELDHPTRQRQRLSVNLYPPASLVTQALRDLILYLNWTRVAVIYEDDLCKLLFFLLFVLLLLPVSGSNTN
jgi:hypothetical protein